jgi:CubicO group peptidase (beta-lactamase class C family)
MVGLESAVTEVVESTGFSGAVRVDRGRQPAMTVTAGLADRAYGIPNGVNTRFAVASVTKGVTALVVVSLIADGAIDLTTPARSLLGKDLPLVADEVTVEHLLAHRSGIGDYLDEESDHPITDYALDTSAHLLDSTEAYLPVLDGHPAVFVPGARFAYCDAGYVILALLAERATGASFAELVRARVCEPAGMLDTGFLRSDELPGDAAVGYLTAQGVRTNVFHLPVVGSGDGGLYSTLADVHGLWYAFIDGAIVAPEWVQAMIEPRSHEPRLARRYGLGFWLDATGQGIMLEGYDAGVSIRSVHEPDTDVTWTVVSNTSDGAWPVVRRIVDYFAVLSP